MGLFKSDEEKERDRKYGEAIHRIMIFPGSVIEYGQFQKYEVEVIDTKRENKGVTLTHVGGKPPNVIRDREFGEYLVEQGIEAIVNAERIDEYGAQNVILDSIKYYGLPVRRKREK